MMYLYKINRNNQGKPTYDLLLKSIKLEEVDKKQKELISEGLEPSDIILSNFNNWEKLNRNEVNENENK